MPPNASNQVKQLHLHSDSQVASFTGQYEQIANFESSREKGEELSKDQ